LVSIRYPLGGPSSSGEWDSLFPHWVFQIST
jgi:hypothetical protein